MQGFSSPQVPKPKAQLSGVRHEPRDVCPGGAGPFEDVDGAGRVVGRRGDQDDASVAADGDRGAEVLVAVVVWILELCLLHPLIRDHREDVRTSGAVAGAVVARRAHHGVGSVGVDRDRNPEEIRFGRVAREELHGLSTKWLDEQERCDRQNEVAGRRGGRTHDRLRTQAGCGRDARCFSSRQSGAFLDARTQPFRPRNDFVAPRLWRQGMWRRVMDGIGNLHQCPMHQSDITISCRARIRSHARSCSDLG